MLLTPQRSSPNALNPNRNTNCNHKPNDKPSPIPKLDNYWVGFWVVCVNINVFLPICLCLLNLSIECCAVSVYSQSWYLLIDRPLIAYTGTSDALYAQFISSVSVTHRCWRSSDNSGLVRNASFDWSNGFKADVQVAPTIIPPTLRFISVAKYRMLTYW